MPVQRYEFVEGTSKKFWEIELDGSAFTARWGRIGTAGQEKQQSFATPEAARAAHDKLIAEKVKKGYQPVDGPSEPAPAPAKSKIKSNPELEAIIAENPDDIANWRVYADWLIENGEAWGEVIALMCAGDSGAERQRKAEEELLKGIDGASITWKFGVIHTLDLSPEEEPEKPGQAMDKVLARILAHPAGRLLRKAVLGLPPQEDGETEWSFDSIFAVFRKCEPLPLLESIDMSRVAGHMDQDSWRRVGDLSPLWKAAPRLRELYLLGASGSDDGVPVAFGKMVAPHLEKFVYKSSGLDESAPLTFGSTELPSLRHLELWLGRDEYGNNCSIDSLAGILAGKGLPKLKRLGLMNSEWEVDLIEAIVNSAILPRLEGLDLSMGILCRDGAAKLLEHADKFRHLFVLELSENYLLPEDVMAIEKVLPNAIVDGQRDLEGD
ncbi:MAG: WGR domain-containing protein, partial [Kofleriaceae bacterium]